MSEYLNWSRLFESGGPALVILLLCSLLCLTVIVERLLYFRRKTVAPARLLEAFLASLGTGRALHPRDAEDFRRQPAGYVLVECLGALQSAEHFDEVKSRAIAEKLPELERYLGIVATLGTVSPYVGLLGTVFGIIRAFMSLGAAAGAANMNELNAGIAEALIATAAGLFVAIPATIAYNHFRRRVGTLVLDMEIAASRLKTALVYGTPAL